MSELIPRWVTELERQIQSLEERVGSVHKELRELKSSYEQSILFTLAIIGAAETSVGLSLVTTAGHNLSQEQTLRQIEAFLVTVIGFLHKFQTIPWKESFESLFQTMVGITITISSAKGIAFDAIAALLLQKLGIPMARKLVDTTKIVESYGLTNANEWKRMVGTVI